MRIVNPTDWHTWRANGIGSSDAATVVRVNPYQDYDALLYSKASRVPITKTGNIIRHGKVLEEYVREFLNEKNNWNLQPLFCIHKDYPFILASLDGIDTSRGILVEIKAPIYPYHGIPIYYLVQIYHQMAVTEYDMALFVVYCRNKLNITEVKRDDQAIQFLIEQENIFWNKVLELREKLGDRVEENRVSGITTEYAI